MAKKKPIEVSVQDQLEEVSKMTETELKEVADKGVDRPGIVRQFARAVLDGEIGDTLKIIKETAKMEVPEVDEVDQTVDELAVGDDDEAFYTALIKQNVAQLTRKNASPQEVARLSQNINIFRKELRDIRSRKPKEGTVLAKVLAAADAVGAKPAKKTVSKKKPAKAKNVVKNKPKSTPKPARATKTKKTVTTSSKVKKNAKKAK